MMRRVWHRAQGGGFTLIEVLVTITLAAIILPVAMKGISMATNLGSQAKRQAEAIALAETKLAEVITTASWQTDQLSGDFAPDWPEFQWNIEVKDWQDPALRDITMHVTWTQLGREREVKLTTLAYIGSTTDVPTAEPPAE
jgi:prepilin-type N-terminal cleavage/methylation domain-containing protein